MPLNPPRSAITRMIRIIVPTDITDPSVHRNKFQECSRVPFAEPINCSGNLSAPFPGIGKTTMYASTPLTFGLEVRFAPVARNLVARI